MLRGKELAQEPYRVLFPLGIVSLVCGAFIWLPLLWEAGLYPKDLHRSFMFHGFVACLVGGFLMTAVPRFSLAPKGKVWELLFFISVSALGFAFEPLFIFQPLFILYFLVSRVKKRERNPPPSFLFVFIGLFAWLAGLISVHLGADEGVARAIVHEASVATIILGVGSKLIPGILGHTSIVSKEQSKISMSAYFRSMPKYFFILPFLFIFSYFFNSFGAVALRAAIVLFLGLKFWKLHKTVIYESALSNCLRACGWLILISFFLPMVFGVYGSTHVSHGFFITSIVLLSLLIATRVLVSHGSDQLSQENNRVLYYISSMIIISAFLRVGASFCPKFYFLGLGLSSSFLGLGVIIWAATYSKFLFTRPKKISLKLT